MTTAATMPELVSDFAPAGWELLGTDMGAGTRLPCEHWHVGPQVQVLLPQRPQPLAFAPQQACWLFSLAWHRGQPAADAFDGQVSTAPAGDAGALPHPQPVSGIASAGIMRAASHTTARTAMLCPELIIKTRNRFETRGKA